jgi:uncharacterized membrane protein
MTAASSLIFHHLPSSPHQPMNQRPHTHPHSEQEHPCRVCGKVFPASQLVSGTAVREGIAKEIRKEIPDWSEQDWLCKPDYMRFRESCLSSLILEQKGELSDLETEVVQSLSHHEIISEQVEEEFNEGRTFGERVADNLARFGGSWSFLLTFAAVLVVWIVFNSIALLAKPFAPYPFILLNLVLSCLAAVQAPVIMMSQNRQEAKDRLRAQKDYQINLKAELEIRSLHDKLDHTLAEQWRHIADIQRLQLELLQELQSMKH